jgi:hypothetical protein
MHGHKEASNVLGHAILTAKPEGIWADAFFNDTDNGVNTKKLVQHKDLDSLSIFANEVVEKSLQVLHGFIREVSLVLSGANPGAKIMNVRIAHSMDDIEELADEVTMVFGEKIEFKHSAVVEDPADDGDDAGDVEELTAQEVFDTLTETQQEVVHAMLGAALEVDDPSAAIAHAAGDKTLQEIYDGFTEEQKNVVHYMIGAAISAAGDNTTAAHSGTNTEGNLIHQEGNDMNHNLFEGNGKATATNKDGVELKTLSHSDIETINENAKKVGSYKEAFIAHAASLGYGIDDIEFLFPDAKTVNSQPDLIARRTEWVKDVIDGAKHSPFSRVKSIHSDLTAEQARAKGYVKGNLKKDEVIRLLKRVTTPTTVYKKQKLDRDDIIDITGLDVVAWLKWEMRFMLEEELARAILIGDGREPDAEDKIDEDKLRPIAWDNEMYAHPVNLPANTSTEGIVESVLRARKFYKGTGTPTFFTTDDILTDMLLIKNKLGTREYKTEGELAAAMRVSKITVVEVMEDTPDLLGIIVNMADYTIGADQGGQLAMFEDFDIDYNQQKYLMETRISGALTKAKSAVVIKRTTGTTVIPLAPAYNTTTHVMTVPTITGVSYVNVTNPLAEVALTNGAAITLTATVDIEARPTTGYNFAHNTDADWTIAYTA